MPGSIAGPDVGPDDFHVFRERAKDRQRAQPPQSHPPFSGLHPWNPQTSSGPAVPSMLTGNYDAVFVALSVVVAMLASYAALDLAGRVASATGNARMGWVAGGATVMGLGIWSMHFVGMIAFRLPIRIAYDLP